MFRPPPERRARPLGEPPTWRAIIASYALIAVVFVVLWGLAHPVAGVVLLVALTGLATVGPRAVGLVRCLVVCREITLPFGEVTQVTITRAPDGPNCRDETP